MDRALRLQHARTAAGLTQAELARRAGVSRALVSAVEAGRHLPRVDAALALARALGTTAAALFAATEPVDEPVDALSGERAAPGSAVRLAFVGERAVTTPVRHGDTGWDAVDAIVGGSSPASRSASEPQVVLAGCEPGLRTLERLLAGQGAHALAITASSATALAALAADRLHAAVAHYRETDGPPAFAGPPLHRVHLARWRVGLAASRGGRKGWWQSALGGRKPVIQREAEASAQAAFERARREAHPAGREAHPAGRAARRERAVPGPRVDSHLAASRLALATGLPAVTIEPAAAAVGADFHPLETHRVELWLSAARASESGVVRLLDALHAAAYRRTLESVGGYDLSDAGRRVA
ncbi:MAG: helix-turn-helix domain-containing protein [Myxococcota bacterium]